MLLSGLGHPQVPGYKESPSPKMAWRVLVSEKGTREYDRLRVLPYPTSASERKAPHLPSETACWTTENRTPSKSLSQYQQRHLNYVCIAYGRNNNHFA